MTEEEQWQELERKQRRHNELICMQNAVVEAQRFIESSKDELGIMTLRKAYEMGYKAGFYDASNTGSK
jgi:hypothetical protein